MASGTDALQLLNEGIALRTTRSTSNFKRVRKRHACRSDLLQNRKKSIRSGRSLRSVSDISA
jgi:hypothetical protein